MPKPTDNGLTYTFKIRKGVKFHDGSPLTAQDVAASWNKIVHPPKGVASARENNFVMVDTITAPGRRDGGVQAEIRHADVPAGAGRSLRLHLFEEEARPGHALVREEHHGVRSLQADRVSRSASPSRASAIPTTIIRASLTSTASWPSSRPSKRYASTPSAPTARPWNSGQCRRLRAISWSRSSATRSRCRRATGTAATW